jgi:hypothetical protein
MRETRTWVSFIFQQPGDREVCTELLYNGMDQRYSATTPQYDGGTRFLKRRKSVVPHCLCSAPDQPEILVQEE